MSGSRTQGDQVAAGDLVSDVAEPITIRAFAAWLGVDDDEAARVWRVVDEVHAAGAALLDCAFDAAERPSVVERARAASAAIADVVGAMLGRAEAGAFGVLARGADALSLAILMVEAGMPTLADAIASSLVDLVEHPGAERDDRLVEELLRRASPIGQFARRARREIELGGCTIRAGDQVVLWFVAANHDPRVFAQPHALIPDRAPNPHFAFGVGPHRCLGASLARRVLREVVSQWPAGIVLAGPPVRRASSYQRGFTSAPIRRVRANETR